MNIFVINKTDNKHIKTCLLIYFCNFNINNPNKTDMAIIGKYKYLSATVLTKGTTLLIGKYIKIKLINENFKYLSLVYAVKKIKNNTKNIINPVIYFENDKE